MLRCTRRLSSSYNYRSGLRMSSTFSASLDNSSPAPAATHRPLALPRLPVPELRSTLDKYLASIKPFLLEDASRGGTPFEEAYALRVKWAEEFTAGFGSVSQDRLKALDRKSPNNWLDDNFWLNQAYLQWRTPLLVNSNWWLAFNDDEKNVSEALSDSGHTSWQVKRAAWLAHRVLEFKDKVDRQELYPDTTRTGVWFRDNISRMFNLARIPFQKCDYLSASSASSSPQSRKITVLANNWFYNLRVYDFDSLTGFWTLQSPAKILAGLNAIVIDAESRSGSAPEIGVLSADDRDIWASNLQYLSSLSPTNIMTHDSIKNSLMCVCLDNTTHSMSHNTSNSSIPPLSGTTQAKLDSHLHAIRSVSSNVANRFFDKPISIIVDPSGRAGAMGEHSAFDAFVPSMVAEYALVEGVDSNLVPDLSGLADQCWERLDWAVDEQILTATRGARERAVAIINNSDYSVLWFEEYGVKWIKDVTKFSPDAYIQMAIQLAWYRTRGEFTATYETALTRMFKKGRTETIRTFTTDSRAFVLAMIDPTTTSETRFSLLRRAAQTHTSLSREACTGRGIDRHILGLRNMLGKDENPALFSDPLFARSQEWKLSTSGLHAGHFFRGTGFGAVYEDGYGINYLGAPDMVKFGIESKFSSPLTSTERFKSAVLDAMRDMQAVCLGSASILNISGKL